MILTKKELKEELEYGIYNITFTKINGETRRMKCTLLPKYFENKSTLPKKTINEKPQRKESENNLVVWDIEAKGIRSFIVANVTKIEKVKNDK
ncbi:DUF2693 domain-containing protein [archaeon]|nr:DUF2693 domain-containing protein [archaeon]NCQ51384.1 DUF2693 domain-containing protein [archaeon]NCT58790.1 DUF2693 domain-containing protein [archaeon]